MEKTKRLDEGVKIGLEDDLWYFLDKDGDKIDNIGGSPSFGGGFQYIDKDDNGNYIICKDKGSRMYCAKMNFKECELEELGHIEKYTELNYINRNTKISQLESICEELCGHHVDLSYLGS